MADCPYCQKPVRWWQPMTTWRDRPLYCPHCMRALRVDRRRYGVLTGLSTAAIATATLVPTEHPYALVAAVGALALVACALFGKVQRDEDTEGEPGL